MPEIILTFEWDGKTVHKSTKGFIGKACTAKTSFIDKALGLTGGSVTFTEEYYKEEQKADKNRIKL